MYKKFFCFALNFMIIFNLIFVNVQAIPASPFDENYTWEEYLEDASNEAAKVLCFVFTTAGAFCTGDYTKLMESCKLYSETFGTGEWVHVDSSGNVSYDQELIDFLKQFILDYAQEHPEEVEKINYRIMHTTTYEQMFKNFMDYGNVLKGDFVVPDGSNSMDFWEKLWLSQNKYDFPHLLSAPTLERYIDPENVKDVRVSQFFTMYEAYEKNLTDPTKTSCFIGQFGGGGNSWGDERQYFISLFTYDYNTGSLTLDRSSSSNQNMRFLWDADNKVWNGTESGHYLFSSGFNAYVNVSYTYQGINYSSRGCLMNMDDVFKDRYYASYNSDKSVNIPALATPNGSSFRLFATEQDAMRYYETCANSGLNFDPDLVYTGGSITINNNGDVIINNNPPNEGDNNSTDANSSGWLEKIYNRLGDILTQVKQIKWLTVADVVLNALDSFGGGIGNIASALVDALSQVFPLCILWDFVKIVELFEAEPVPPVLKIPIKFGWLDETITIDLTEYDTIFTMLRFGEVALFLIGLFDITMSWVGKGDEVV